MSVICSFRNKSVAVIFLMHKKQSQTSVDFCLCGLCIVDAFDTCIFSCEMSFKVKRKSVADKYLVDDANASSDSPDFDEEDSNASKEIAKQYKIFTETDRIFNNTPPAEKVN